MSLIKAQPFDCMQYLYSQVQNPLIRCCLHFSGKLDVGQLMRAISHLRSVFPIFDCRFDHHKQCWRYEGSFASDNYLVVVPVEHLDHDALVKETLQSSIRIEADPPIKFYLISSTNADTLCVIASHLMCDGRGLVRLLERLAAVYTELPASEDIDEEWMMRREFSQLIKELPRQEKMRILTSRSVVATKCGQPYLPLTGATMVSFLFVREIGERDFSAIRRYAKQHGSSINDILITAYMRELYKQWGWTAITLPCPVDLRRFTEAEEACGIGNLTSNYFCHVDFGEDESFDETLRTVSRQMKVQKASHHCLKGPMLYHLLYRFLPFSILKKIFFILSPVPVTSYTNIGVIDDKKMKFGQLEMVDAYFVTATKCSPYFQLTTSTFKGKCTLTSSSLSNDQDQQIISNLINGIIKSLQQLHPG